MGTMTEAEIEARVAELRSRPAYQKVCHIHEEHTFKQVSPIMLAVILREADQVGAEEFVRKNGAHVRILSVPYEVKEALNLLHGFTLPVTMEELENWSDGKSTENEPCPA